MAVEPLGKRDQARSARHRAILEIIAQHAIDTQEALTERLNAQGIKATQATVSRDIKELRLVKALSEHGEGYYTVTARTGNGVADRMIRIFQETVLSIASAGQLIVVKTLPGSAHAASEAVDNMGWPEALGTLAGDNTFVIIVGDPDKVAPVMDRLHRMVSSGRA